MARPAHILSFDEAKAQDARRRPSSRTRKSTENRRDTRARYASADIKGVRRTSSAHASRETYDARGVREDYYELEATEADEQAPVRASSKKDAKRKRRSAKADRQFAKRYGDDGAADDSGSRAALYKGEMGRTQRKSMRMNDERSGRKPAKRTFGMRASSFFHSPKFTKAALGLCIFAFFAVIVYQPLSDYYGEVRQYQRLQAELTALEEHNARVESEIGYLRTQEGLEEYARAELGWIKPNEHAVNVEGVTVTPKEESQASEFIDSVPEGSVSAPQTWYSPILDPLLGYRG